MRTYALTSLVYITDIRVSGRPVLLLLHGFLGASGDWLRFITELESLGKDGAGAAAAAYCCLAVDLPGHGASASCSADVPAALCVSWEATGTPFPCFTRAQVQILTPVCLLYEYESTDTDT